MNELVEFLLSIGVAVVASAIFGVFIYIATYISTRNALLSQELRDRERNRRDW